MKEVYVLGFFFTPFRANMSVLEYISQAKVMILCHKSYLEDLYGSTGELKEHIEMFDLRVPFMMDQEAEKVARTMEGEEVKGKKKRKTPDVQYSFPQEVELLKKSFQEAAASCDTHFTGEPTPQDFRDNNKKMREAVKDLFSTLNCVELPSSGENAELKVLREGLLLLPPRCSFVTCDVAELEQYISGQVDIIVMDPPWGNRHVKRVRWSTGYTMMADNDPCLASLPISTLLRPGGLVLAWCTNSPKHRATLTDCFATWDLHLEATWYWLKVTRHGHLVSDFSAGKQPYEVLMVGRRKGGDGTSGRSKASHIKVPEDLVMISVPSAIHSHKPPLNEVLERLVMCQGISGEGEAGNVLKGLDKLELFGR